MDVTEGVEILPVEIEPSLPTPAQAPVEDAASAEVEQLDIEESKEITPSSSSDEICIIESVTEATRSSIPRLVPIETDSPILVTSDNSSIVDPPSGSAVSINEE